MIQFNYYMLTTGVRPLPGVT